MLSILVVEDENQIRELIVEFLKEDGYSVDEAGDGLDGYSKFKNKNYDLIIVDWMMPKLDGYGLCNLIRQDSDVPIIFLTALSDEEDQVKAFDAKADDFITKPFSFNILIKRVEALLRRNKKQVMTTENVLEFADLKLNNSTYKAYENDEELELTLKEFNILKLFIESYPSVVTREVLMDKIWGYDYYGDMRVIDAHIKNIRKKFKKEYIKTVKGVGYVLQEVLE